MRLKETVGAPGLQAYLCPRLPGAGSSVRVVLGLRSYVHFSRAIPHENGITRIVVMGQLSRKDVCVYQVPLSFPGQPTGTVLLK